ncbi:hypothetical protein GCM10022214_00110 [Actinomadura miaoliensis]|uniref:Uncharacterized protein n=1 Tax=Actinomadura miaoliensis TaxID=430685 RepID=A0ABP7UUY1_9ACTN
MWAERSRLVSASAWRIAAKAGNECHHLIDSEVMAYDSAGMDAIEQARDLAREVCRDVRGGGAQVEIGGCERALHRCVLRAEAIIRDSSVKRAAGSPVPASASPFATSCLS